VIAAAGWRFESAYGGAMTSIGIVYFLLKSFLLTGAAFVVGRAYLKKLAGGTGNSRSLRGVIGFGLLFAVFYGWAAWSVGAIAALPIRVVDHDERVVHHHAG